MPNVFSKPVSNDASVPFKRTYDEPIPFVPQTDKGNLQKPKEIKIKLRRDPMDPESETFTKVFMEFVDSTPEAYCQWMCDMDEYMKGAGIDTPAARITASQQLLSQAHRVTWDNCVSQVLFGETATNDAEVHAVYSAFALTFMNATA
jgi:hypothetical protein